MNNGLDGNGLFRTSIRFQGQARGVRRDEETGRLVPNSEATPEYSVSTERLIGLAVVFMVSLGMVIGFMLAVNR